MDVGTEDLTVDQLARLAGTTTRNVRALQTQGLLPRPRVVGRTGYYGAEHRRRLSAVLRLQREGFSLGVIATLFAAQESGRSLDEVLGVAPGDAAVTRGPLDAADAFEGWRPPRHGRLLSIVPSTLIDQAAS